MAKAKAKAAKPAKASTKAKAGAKPRKRPRNQNLPGIVPDGQIGELEDAIEDAYTKTLAWKAALQPMMDAKARVSDLMHARKLSTYTTADGVSATIKAAKERLALRGEKHDDGDVDVDGGDA